MQNHTVEVDVAAGGVSLKFAPIFNVAVPFIDRHLDEGRADKVVIRTNQAVEVTYAELAQKVNRCGNALLDLGIGQGDRVIMIVKDCAEFFYCF
ncbi:MAG: AMP-binding protein, partial [Geopsychrobacter sp.]|nr:AMP-binding protein [Geopsychrobacter sp.]